MIKRLFLILLAALLFILCACSSVQGAENCATVSVESLDTEVEYYWDANVETSFPLGMSTVISRITADNTCIFLAGMWEDKPVLSRLEYKIKNNCLELGHCLDLELPELFGGAQVLGLSHGGSRFYLLLGIPSDESTEFFRPLVCVYQADGSFERSFQVEYADDETPLSILGLDGGSFCLRSIHHFRLYSPDGLLTSAIFEPGYDLYPPLLVNGELLIQSRDPGTGRSALNILDSVKQELSPVAYPSNISPPTSIVESVAHSALINTGTELMRINAYYEAEPVLDWYSLTGDYSYDYRCICQLDENTFLIVPKDSAELRQLQLKYLPDNRKTVRIGFYGSSTPMLDDISRKLTLYNSEYKVEAISYGDDDAGLKALLADVSAQDRLDIVISEGYQLDPTSGFADLYPFIDGDKELSRDDFIPFILKGLERNGELKQIWGSFSMGTFMATGPLALGPHPLKLADCQSWLDSTDYDGLLFDPWITRETLLSFLADDLLAESFNTETSRYVLNTSKIHELAALCLDRPAEFDFTDAAAADSQMSQVLCYMDIQLDYLNRLEKDGQLYRLFDGSSGSDNFTSLSANYGSCYMIPETCKDKEKAWGFLRNLLTSDFQQKSFSEDKLGYPSNTAAFQAVLESYSTERTSDALYSLMDAAVFIDYDAVQLRGIFLNCMKPYLYGDRDIETALADTEGRINIYAAEHQHD